AYENVAPLTSRQNRVSGAAPDARFPSRIRIAGGRHAVVLIDIRAVEQGRTDHVRRGGALVTHSTTRGGAAVDAQATQAPLVGAAPHEVRVKEVRPVRQLLHDRHRGRPPNW